jgi:D-arabinose 1-dehydrogenase-like Zn-dependent alcohol dehydrogenase
VGDFVFGWPGRGKGTHAEYVCMPELGAVDFVPANMNLAEAASIFCGGMTALVFLQKAHIEPGQSVLIYGASGAVGVFAVQLAQAFRRPCHWRLRPHEPGPGPIAGADAVIDSRKMISRILAALTMSSSTQLEKVDSHAACGHSSEAEPTS